MPSPTETTVPSSDRLTVLSKPSIRWRRIWLISLALISMEALATSSFVDELLLDLGELVHEAAVVDGRADARDDAGEQRGVDLHVEPHLLAAGDGALERAAQRLPLR